MSVVAFNWYQGSGGSASVNSATKQVWFTFVAPNGNATSGIKMHVASVSGTIGAGECYVSLYDADSAGNPTGSPLATGSNTAALTSGLVTINFGSAYTLTSGNAYVLVVENKNSVPATNYFTIKAASRLSPTSLLSHASFVDTSSMATQYLFSATPSTMFYIVQGASVLGPINNINDGGYGYPIYNTTTSRRWAGGELVLSSRLSLSGFTFAYTTNGNALNDSRIRFEIYNASLTLLLSKAMSITGSTWLNSLGIVFPPITLSAGTYYLMVRGDSDFGTAWNDTAQHLRVHHYYGLSIPSQPSELIQSFKVAYGSASGASPTSFSVADNTWVSSGVWGNLPSGGGLLVNPGLNGGLIQI